MNPDENCTNPARLANKAELAEWFDVSIPAINAWVRRGCPYIQHGNKTTPWVFDVLAVHQWLDQRDAGSCAPVPTNPADMTPQDRRYWYEGERARIACESAAMALAEKKATVVWKTDYDAEMTRVLTVIANGLERMPDAVAHILPTEGVAAMREEIEHLVTLLREEMASL